MKKIFFALGILVIVVLQSCLKDNFNFDKLAKGSWDPDIAIPLAYSSVTIQDIIDTTGIGTTVEVASDNFCTIVYSSNLLSKKATEFISIPSQNFSNVVNISGQLAGVTATYTQTVDFVTDSLEVDSILFKTLSYTDSIANNSNSSGTIVVTIPAAKKNGVPFTQTLNISPNATVVGSANLAGYNFDMTRNGTTTNRFDIVYQVTLNSAIGVGTLSANNSMRNISFQRIVGYLGKRESLSPFQDTVVINLFKKAFGSGTFKINDPTIRLDVTNSYGLPIQLNFTRFDGYNPNSTPQLITITGVPSPLNINFPALSEIGQSKTTTVILDKNTTNNTIVGALNNNKSAYLIYQPNSKVNPSGPTSNRNFILDNSQFNVDIDVRLPLFGSAKDFVLQDTIRDFKIDNIGNINNFTLKAYVVNGFPVDLDVQVYFVDSLFKGPIVNGVQTMAIDSLASSDIFMRSAAIDANGRATTPTTQSHEYPYTKERIEKLKDAKHLLFRARASSTNNGASDIRIYATDRLDVKLGVRTQIHTEF